jgi:hypothetical protein
VEAVRPDVKAIREDVAMAGVVAVDRGDVVALCDRVEALEKALKVAIINMDEWPLERIVEHCRAVLEGHEDGSVR